MSTPFTPSADAPPFAAVAYPARTDRIGMVASILCAVHCGAASLIAGASGVLENPRLELMLIGLAAAIATLAFVGGYRQHRSRTPAVVGAVAMLVLVLSKTLHVEALDLVGSVVGGLGLAGAHWLNLREGKCAIGCCS